VSQLHHLAVRYGCIFTLFVCLTYLFWF